MAKNTDETAIDEPPASTKKKSIFSDTGTDVDGLRWGELVYEGTTYRLRQITVDEGDEAWDAAMDTKTGKFNGRLNSRLSLASSIVSPPTSVDDMGRWSGTKLIALLRGYDALNLLEDADTEGNA